MYIWGVILMTYIADVSNLKNTDEKLKNTKKLTMR